MKRFLVAFFMLLLLTGVATADVYKTGFLSTLNMTEQEFQDFLSDKKNSSKFTRVFTSEKNVTEREIKVRFYDSLMTMQMALDAGEIEVMVLPEDVAEYVMETTRKYSVSTIVRIPPLSLALGFRKKDGIALRDRFNEALSSMKADGTLAMLQTKYIHNAGIVDPEPVKIEKFDGSNDTVKVAITGDMPPIDFIAADGTPAGFNTAVLAELGKRMKINIEFVNIDSGARAASLASGRCDVVFWVFTPLKWTSSQKRTDVPDEIELSDAYYSWIEMFHLKRAENNVRTFNK